tara:strand:- start:617 stop:781 length:165 start_codon:yes stop_codon:yes gene_type:complete
MILYLEKQLDDAYDIYRRHQIKQDAAFISKENFRTMFEEIMEVVYSEPETEAST